MVAMQVLPDPPFQKELGQWTASSCEHLWGCGHAPPGHEHDPWGTDNQDN